MPHILPESSRSDSVDERNVRVDRRAIRRMSKVDGCPECLNYETPRSVSPTADGYQASYECTACRHTWTTSWRDD